MVFDSFTNQLIAMGLVCCAVGLGVLYVGKLRRDDQRERDAEDKAKAAQRAG